MIVRLLRDARIRHAAGEVVEVSPEEAAYLISTKSAEPAKERVAKNARKGKKSSAADDNGV